MSSKNFVNQFKNTRRQAGIHSAAPLGGQARLQFGKGLKKSGQETSRRQKRQRNKF